MFSNLIFAGSINMLTVKYKFVEFSIVCSLLWFLNYCPLYHVELGLEIRLRDKLKQLADEYTLSQQKYAQEVFYRLFYLRLLAFIQACRCLIYRVLKLLRP